MNSVQKIDRSGTDITIERTINHMKQWVILNEGLRMTRYLIMLKKFLDFSILKMNMK